MRYNFVYSARFPSPEATANVWAQSPQSVKRGHSEQLNFLPQILTVWEIGLLRDMTIFLLVSFGNRTILSSSKILLPFPDAPRVLPILRKQFPLLP